MCCLNYICCIPQTSIKVMTQILRTHRKATPAALVTKRTGWTAICTGGTKIPWFTRCLVHVLLINCWKLNIKRLTWILIYASLLNVGQAFFYTFFSYIWHRLNIAWEFINCTDLEGKQIINKHLKILKVLTIKIIKRRHESICLTLNNTTSYKEIIRMAFRV